MKKLLIFFVVAFFTITKVSASTFTIEGGDPQNEWVLTFVYTTVMVTILFLIACLFGAFKSSEDKDISTKKATALESGNNFQIKVMENLDLPLNKRIGERKK